MTRQASNPAMERTADFSASTLSRSLPAGAGETLAPGRELRKRSESRS